MSTRIQKHKSGWGLYVMAHIVFLSAVVAVVCAHLQMVSTGALIKVAAFTLCSILVLTKLYHQRKWALRLEILRVLVLFLLIWLVGFKVYPGFVFGYLSMSLVVCSSAFLTNAVLYRILAEVYEF